MVAAEGLLMATRHPVQAHITCFRHKATKCRRDIPLYSASPWSAGTFDLLVYTDAMSNVPQEWEDSDPRFIQNAADVKLRSFTTKVSLSFA